MSPNVRRRLELSFGDSLFASPSTELRHRERIKRTREDPFHAQHVQCSPSGSLSPCANANSSINRFDSMDFSPTGSFQISSPPITPVRMDDDVSMSESPISM